MTRINTNISSLIAQNHLRRNEVDLQEALTRLSTGLRINVGKDDPAGLIASESLQSDITAMEKAISNTERANQVIATADGALGLVSDLLNDIRGLVVEAANTGAMSEDQIAANQLQVDSSLEAINRIAQTTTFQGRRLLDGSLDFVSTVNTIETVTDYQIDQVNFGASGGVIAVDVDIATAATQAEITNATGFSASANATATLSFAAGATFQNNATTSNFYINATELGTDHSGVVISFADGGVGYGASTAVYDETAGTLVVTIDNGGTTAADVVNAISAEATGSWTATTDVGAGVVTVAADVGTTTDTTGVDSLQLDAVTAGADYNGVAISLTSTTSATGAVFDATQNTIIVNIKNDGGPVLLSAVETVVDSDLAGFFTSTATSSGDTYVNALAEDVNATANTDNTGGNVLNDTLVVSIGGSSGREVFNFETGASINQLAAAINLVSDSTGVGAAFTSGALTLISSLYGSGESVDVDVIDEGSSGTFGIGLSASTAVGTDISVTVNGIRASSSGNSFGINTATLDLSVTVEGGSSTNFDFDITGGGALFQLGPDVVSNQQAVLGIQTLNTAKLGGPSGRLHELASGGIKSLKTAPNLAFPVVDEVINKITTLRGRLGSFQRTSLETNITSLSETLVNLTAAESSIRDADFAKETAALTRAQILAQSGTRVLSIANSTPQNVLSLLQ